MRGEKDSSYQERIRREVGYDVAALASILSSYDQSHEDKISLEYVEPFSIRDRPGERPLRRGEYQTLPPIDEIKLLDLDIDSLFNKSVLYVGLGQSGLPTYMHSIGINCIAIDNDPSTLANNRDRNVARLHSDAESQPFKENSLDAVILKQILNPSLNPRQILKESFRIVKQCGEITIFPVLVFKSIETFDIPELDFIQWGLDWFTLKIHLSESLNIPRVIDLLAPNDLGMAQIAVKPIEGKTTLSRLNGYYFREYRT